MTRLNPHRDLIPTLGLTGGIGSGKSTALAYLHELGAAVLSSDDVVHGLYERPDIASAVRERFGADVVREGVIDRAALARIVFADQTSLAWLEELLHPFVREAVRSWLAAQQEVVPRPVLLAVEVPLLFESDFAPDFDHTVVITAPISARKRRLNSRFSDDDLSRRLDQQLPEEEKMELADFVFANTGSRRELKSFLGETVAHIISADRAGEETE